MNCIIRTMIPLIIMDIDNVNIDSRRDGVKARMGVIEQGYCSTRYVAAATAVVSGKQYTLRIRPEPRRPERFRGGKVLVGVYQIPERRNERRILGQQGASSHKVRWEPRP
jgi:hypothetical protein